MDDIFKDLIESYANYFEAHHNFAPLTSKIYSYLFLDYKEEGITFDELVEVFNASKSSVSNSLTVLTQLRYIEYSTKIDQRKRLYRVAPNATLIRLEKIQHLLQLEKNLSERYRSFILDRSKNAEDHRIIKSDIYIDHLSNTVKQLAFTIQKLKAVHN